LSQKKIVISGVNMVEGGIFTILDNFLQKISEVAQKNNLKVIALVNDASKFNYPNIEYIAFPKSKKKWLYRIYYEYFYFKKLSQKIQPNIWFSLHDMSPNVIADKRIVYCHNPGILYNATFKDWKFDYKTGLFTLFYKYLFQINIKKNKIVFVQQHHIKKEFERLYKIDTVMVSKPEFTEEITSNRIDLDANKVHFFYPSFPRSFKNFEVILDAIAYLSEETKAKTQFHFTTVKDTKTNYAQFLLKKYGHLNAVNFMGEISREQLLSYYNSIDCLIFPSKLETWGLPLSEAKSYKKPILAANLPYAKETVGNYEKVTFFEVTNPKELADLITQFVAKTITFQGNKDANENEKALENWNEVFECILNN
jgi:glycosyltransferase involved in cell wall biosynthesis